MEHEAMKRKWNTLVFVVFLRINTTSYCLPFKICAHEIDLKSLKVLIVDGLYTPS